MVGSIFSPSSPGLTGGPKRRLGISRVGLGPPVQPAADRGMTRWGLAALLVAIASPALAHEGHHEHMSAAQAAHHLLTQPDHQIAFAGLVVAIVAGGWAWVRATARK